ncbi:MAG TPA: subclass B1 metallo-beta-lactamase [Hanamia sp.]|nr:subclass B1 metallo-beta-lactamase [Hanamia sp.]
MIEKFSKITIVVAGIAALIFLFSCNNDSGKNENKKFSGKTIKSAAIDTIVYQTSNLVVRRISEHTYRHVSYLSTKDFGKVSCNGMIITNDGKAVIFDTPANDSASEDLIKYVNKNLNSVISAVIPTHFHEDCVGGLSAFGKHHVPAYASFKTIELLKQKNHRNVSLLKGFHDSLILHVGNQKIEALFMGEGHTKDNIIGYYPEDSILFGGCLVKAIGASKGNLEDANIKAWPVTIENVKRKFPHTKIVIPGHDEPGGKELLDYTFNLFH